MNDHPLRFKKPFPAYLSAAILLLIFASLSVQAAVIRGLPVSVTQPNGEKLALFASGDEYYNWLHDKAGYTVIQDPANGYYVYAKDDNGRLVSSGVAVTASVVANQSAVLAFGLPKGLQVAPELRPKPAEIFPGGSPATQKEILQAPHTGTLNNLVIFIRFAGEAEFTDAISIYDNMFNSSAAGANSMRNYFLEASYAALTVPTSFYPTPTTTVVSYQDSHDRNYYTPYHVGTNPTGYQPSERTAREHTLLKNAVDAVSSQVSAGLNIDGDADGYVDNVCFVIDGDPTAWSTLLWPHMWSLYSVSAYINSKRVMTYNFQLQNHMTSSGVGVLCHEMFHSLGAPDLYHYSSTYSYLHPAYTWDLMEYDLDPPQHMTAYMKYKYGHWIASIPEITTAGTYSLNPLTSATNNCYKIASPLSATEYFVVEYRKKGTSTFEDSLLGEGLLVMRINPAYNGNANGPPDELYIYRPNGTTTADGSPGSANYNSTAGRTAINDSTNPSSFLTAGGAGGLSISGIGAVGSTISFTVDFPYAGTKALSVRATNSGTAITVSPNDVMGQGNGTTDFTRTYLEGQAVSLTAPATSGPLSFQKWYLDGAEHATTPATTVTMNAIHTALAVYGVDLGEAVDNTALGWGTEGKGWFGQTTTAYSGGDAAQSAPITHNEQTYLTANVVGPGTVQWYWKVSSEYGYDFSYFYIDATPYYYASGALDWTPVSVVVPAGAHTLRWSYEKDETESIGSDCAWIDLVTYTGAGVRDWQILSGVNPDAVMRVDVDGTGGDELAGDFAATGLWLYGSASWQQLSGVNPDGTAAVDIDGNGTQEIAGDFGPTGLWLYSGGTWQILSGVNPDGVIAVDLDGNGTQEIAGDFAALGVWTWTGGAWSQISSVNPEALLALNLNGAGGQEVLADFGAIGTWLLSGGVWSQISAGNPQKMIRGNVDGDAADEAYVDFGVTGLWRYAAGGWGQVAAGDPDDLIAADTDGVPGDEIAADFGAAGLSLWKTGAWTLLSGSNASGLAAVEMDGGGLALIVANFPSLGVFKWKSGDGWTQMTGTQAESLGAADLNGDTFEKLVADFGAIGLWVW